MAVAGEAVVAEAVVADFPAAAAAPPAAVHRGVGEVQAIRWSLPFCCGLALSFAVAAADGLLAIPSLRARVTDTTGTLDAQQTQTLETELAVLEQRKGSQLAVLLVPTTQPEEIEQYAIRVVDAWKLGRKNVDDGALLIVAKDDHQVRIEVGRGLEGIIPDAVASRIIREYIAPKFRTNDYYGGVHDAILAMTKLIDGEQLSPPLSKEPKRDPIHALLVAIFTGLWLRGFFGWLPATPRAGAVGAITGGVAWALSGLMPLALGVGVFGLLLGWIGGGGGSFAGGSGIGGWSSGSWGSGGSWGGSGGGFSGGGGGFAGGGASGSW